MKKMSMYLTLAAIGLLFVTGSALAGGTAAGTPVSNQATLDYKVGGVDQTTLNSDDPGVGGTADATTFVVDHKVDLTVAFLADQTVVPGQQNAAMRYSVTNTGNKVMDISLGSVDVGGDNFSSTLVGVYADGGDNTTYNSAVDNVAFIDELAVDTTAYVWIVVNIPTGAANTQVDTWALQATAAAGGTASTEGTALTTETNTLAAEEVVLADAGTNGIESANSNFVVSTATLTISKSVAIVDTGGGLPTDSFAIPGAIMEYTITVKNTSTTVDATTVILIDTLPAQLTWVTGSLTVDGAPQTEATDGDQGEFQGGNVKVTIPTLAANSTVVIMFRGTIK
ncbi:MAG: hypothetical protein RQ724_06455 [Desulfuromonadales bacterium]|nr:hypothetical protein [Desulfuromonadales bacterium]